MKNPPMVLSLIFRSACDEQDAGFRLWLPLFIIVPIITIVMLAALLIALPIVLVSVLITWNVRWLQHAVFIIYSAVTALHELSGLKIDVEERKQRVYIAVE